MISVCPVYWVKLQKLYKTNLDYSQVFIKKANVIFNILFKRAAYIVFDKIDYQ